MAHASDIYIYIYFFFAFPPLRSVTPVLFHATDATLNSKPSSAPKLFHAISICFVFAEPATTKCSRWLFSLAEECISISADATYDVTQ